MLNVFSLLVLFLQDSLLTLLAGSSNLDEDAQAKEASHGSNFSCHVQIFVSRMRLVTRFPQKGFSEIRADSLHIGIDNATRAIPLSMPARLAGSAFGNYLILSYLRSDAPLGLSLPQDELDGAMYSLFAHLGSFEFYAVDAKAESEDGVVNPQFVIGRYGFRDGIMNLVFRNSQQPKVAFALFDLWLPHLCLHFGFVEPSAAI